MAEDQDGEGRVLLRQFRFRFGIFRGRAEWLQPGVSHHHVLRDYSGEEEILYNGKAYGVYRTYKAKTDVLELYVERKGGVNVPVTTE